MVGQVVVSSTMKVSLCHDKDGKDVCLFLDKEIFVVDVRHEFSAYFKKS
jgi:hypothetical protein